jgi:hypothetical protein
MHDHEKHTAESLPEPNSGEQPIYWEGDTQYTMKPMQDRWILFGHFRRGKAHPLGTISRHGETWRASEEGTARSKSDVTLAEALRFLM